MNIIQESVDKFIVGHDGADAAAQPIMVSGRVRKAYKGVRVRAATANTVVIYLGPHGVTTDSGYPLPAGEELLIPIEDPSKVYVVATLAADCKVWVNLAGEITGEPFPLTLLGKTANLIAVDANAATVQAALRALSTIGVTGCTVADTAGGPPYTVTFTGPLAKTDVDLVTSTDGGINETQNVTATDAIAGDKMVLTLGAESTAELAYDASSAQVQSALEALTGIGAGNVSVSDGTTGWDVEFIGDLLGTDVDAMTGVVGKNEKQTMTYLSAPVAGDMLTLSYDGSSAAPIAYDSTSAQVQAALETIGALTGNVSVTDGDPSGWVIEFVGGLAGTDLDFVSGTCGKNEKQTVGIPDTVDTGTFTLTYDGETTAAIAYTAPAADVKTALENLDNIEVDDVAVTGGAGPTTDWVVEFKGNLTRTDVPLMTATSSCGQNEKQTVSIPDTVDIGPFTLTYDGETTGPIPYNSTFGEVQTALEGLTNIGAGQVSVTGGPGPTDDWTVEFTGTLALTDVPLMTATSSCGQNEKQTVGIPDTVDIGTFTLTYDGQTTAPISQGASAATVKSALEDLSNIEVGDVEVTGGPGPTDDWVVEFKATLGLTDVPTMTAVSSCGQNEKQTVSIDPTTTGGTFTLTYDGETTAGINHNATAGDVEDALELLSNIGAGQVAVTGGPGPDTAWIVSFTGTLGLTDVVMMVGNGTSLTGGSSTDVTIQETVKGVTEDVTITESVKGVTADVTIEEAVKGVTATVSIGETVTGHGVGVSTDETAKGNTGTVTVTESQKGDAAFTITVAKVADITLGSQYSWLAV